jgi:hypothetical protein
MESQAPEIAEWLLQEIDWPGALEKWERFGNRPPGEDSLTSDFKPSALNPKL